MAVNRWLIALTMFFFLLQACHKEQNKEIAKEKKDTVAIENVKPVTIEEWAEKNGFTYREDRGNYLFQPRGPIPDVFDFNDFTVLSEYERNKIHGLGFRAKRFENLNLSFFNNLERLNFKNTFFVNLRFLSHANNLKELNLSDVTIEDFSGISMCKELRELEMWDVTFNSLDEISECTYLETINVYSKKSFKLPQDMSMLVNLKEVLIGYDGMESFNGLETIPVEFKFIIPVGAEEILKDASLDSLENANLAVFEIHKDTYKKHEEKIDVFVSAQKIRNPDFKFIIEDY